MDLANSFNYEVMHTTLDIILPNIPRRDAKAAASEFFAELSKIESLISMYIPGSDIAMLNEIPAGETLKITDIAQNCLLEAFRAAEISEGAIDVCMGEFFLRAKRDASLPRPEKPRRGKFAFDTENYMVKKLEDGMIDLGAIGKGFGLDCLYEGVISDWGIKDVFISFGASSILALGRDADGKPWRVNFSDNLSMPLQNAFVGASGTSVLGGHIIDCRTGEIPQNQPFRTWAISGVGALSDAMSTAFMALDKRKIAEICKTRDIVGAVQQTPDSPVEIFE